MPPLFHGSDETLINGLWTSRFKVDGGGQITADGRRLGCDRITVLERTPSHRIHGDIVGPALIALREIEDVPLERFLLSIQWTIEARDGDA